jgi:hypothetical protein
VDPAILNEEKGEFAKVIQESEETQPYQTGKTTAGGATALTTTMTRHRARIRAIARQGAREHDRDRVLVCNHDSIRAKCTQASLYKRKTGGWLVGELNKSGTIQRACAQAGATYVT